MARVTGIGGIFMNSVGCDNRRIELWEPKTPA
jgi:hypothetical protein